MASYVFFSLARFIIEFDTTARNIPCDTRPQKNKIIDATRQPTAIFVQVNIWRLIFLATIFFKFLFKCWSSCGLLGAALCPWEALEAIFVEQRFGPKPPKGQGVDRSSPQEGRLFGHPRDKKKISENVGPLVGSLAPERVMGEWLGPWSEADHSKESDFEGAVKGDDARKFPPPVPAQIEA